METKKPAQKVVPVASFNIAIESKVHCLTIMCVNNIVHVCNLKGLAVDENGMCAGLVKFKPKKENDK